MGWGQPSRVLHGCVAQPVGQVARPACRCGTGADPAVPVGAMIGAQFVPLPAGPGGHMQQGQGWPTTPVVVRGPAGQPPPPPPPGFRYPPGGLLFVPLELGPLRTIELEADDRAAVQAGQTVVS